MKEFWNSIQLIFAAVGGWLGWFLGGCDGLLYALLLFVVLDYLSGVACAIADHKLSSEVGFKGLFRKVLIFSLVGIFFIRYLLYLGLLWQIEQNVLLLPPTVIFSNIASHFPQLMTGS